MSVDAASAASIRNGDITPRLGVEVRCSSQTEAEAERAQVWALRYLDAARLAMAIKAGAIK